ncbi:MAG: DNA-binding transcriptional regulator [Neisseriaceae bacterium]|nr:DNA-binding transcriptional regulator [Neisseriaceae bacterium]
MKYKSELLGAIHETMAGAYQAGAIDMATMEHFNQSCLTHPKALNGDEIRQMRQKEHLTQAAFADILNVSKNNISAWERNIRKPQGAALKLLTIVKNKGIQAVI